MPTTIAIIAPGAMGSAVARRLTDHGARVLTSLAGRGAASVERARSAGMIDASDDVIAQEADIVLSMLPPAAAVGLAQQMSAAFRRTGRRPLFADCNAINVATVLQIESLFGPPDDSFVDGAIIGGPPRPGTDGPTFYFSGAGAARLSELQALGLRVRIIAGPIGAASALKMSYAGIVKGFTAVGAAMVLAAARAGALDALADELAASQPHLRDRLAVALPDMLPKAYRWVAEMQEIAAFIGNDFPEHAIYEGHAALFERLAAVGDDERAVLTGFAARPARAPS